MEKALFQREGRFSPLLATCPVAEAEERRRLPEVLEEQLLNQRLPEAKEERVQG